MANIGYGVLILVGLAILPTVLSFIFGIVSEIATTFTNAFKQEGIK